MVSNTTPESGNSALIIPDIDGLNIPQTALAYADAGIPVALFDATRGDGNSKGKQCGNLVGNAQADDNWYNHVTTDPEVINDWLKRFGARCSGIATSPGEAHLVVIDGDHPEHIPQDWWPYLNAAPFANTRPDEDQRGHYWFACNGQLFGNPAFDWGELRCVGGGLVLPPTPVGNRRWVRTGAVPMIPALIECWLREHYSTRAVVGRISSEEVDRFSTEHTGDERPKALRGLVKSVADARSQTRNLTRDNMRVAAGESRIKFYPWKRARDEFEKAMRASYAARKDPKARFSAYEFARLERNAISWANAQSLEKLGEIANRDYGHRHDEDEIEIDEEWFWDSRQWLRDLRQFARSRRVSPWGMLGCVLVRILSTIPPDVVLPPLVGSFATVNTFIAICGDPATSKSALMKAAEDFLIIKGVDVPTYNPGSAEAIPKSFAYIEPAKKATNTQLAVPAQQIGLAWSVVFAVPEVETLLEQANGNQILAALRSIWSGENPSKRYAGDAHNVRIMPHRSRCNVILGVQWEFGDRFFGAVGVGTPQRIIYLPARDTEQIKIKPKSPKGITLDAWPNSDGKKPTQLELVANNAWLVDQLDKRQKNFTAFKIPDITRDEVDNHAMFRSGPEELDNTDPLDGHLLLAQEKIAVAFAVMDGMYKEFNAEHWKLSGIVALKSKQTRTILYRKVNEEEARKRNRQARYAGIARHKAELSFNEAQERDAARVAKLIYGKLDKNEWVSRRDIRGMLSGRDRGFFDPAIEELDERIEIEERPNTRGRSSSYYRRAP